MPSILGRIVLIAIIAYLWGSLPFGYWMGKFLRGKDFDIRTCGSHKIGATNVLRILGKGPAAIVFLLDISKGIGPALLTTHISLFMAAGWGTGVAGLAALFGHCFPIFIGFKGGRGVLTAAGALLIISPLAFVIAAITAFSSIGISRYSSLGSIVGGITSIVCGIIFFFVGKSYPIFIGYINLPNVLFMVVAPSFVILLHYDNIFRLLQGSERKIGQKIL